MNAMAEYLARGGTVTVCPTVYLVPVAGCAGKPTPAGIPTDEVTPWVGSSRRKAHLQRIADDRRETADTRALCVLNEWRLLGQDAAARRALMNKYSRSRECICRLLRRGLNLEAAV